MYFHKFLLVSISLFFCISTPSIVEAAVLYIQPSEGEYQVGDIFIAEVRIDTEEECVNVIELGLEYDRDILEAKDVSYGSSVITLWIKEPEIDQEKGFISFTGGIPGGYCGELAGDPGPSHFLAKIAFQAKKESEAKINFLDSGQVLLNDGQATPARLEIRGASFTILAEKEEPLKDEWQEELLGDIFPPQPFEIKIHQDPEIFNNKYFIIFFTTDKQTGVDHYEVKEGQGDWHKAESPYLLEDQTLESIIKVKAVDKSRNERIAEYIPEVLKKTFPWWIIIIIVIVLAIIGWYVISKIKYQKSK